MYKWCFYCYLNGNLAWYFTSSMNCSKAIASFKDCTCLTLVTVFIILLPPLWPYFLFTDYTPITICIFPPCSVIIQGGAGYRWHTWSKPRSPTRSSPPTLAPLPPYRTRWQKEVKVAYVFLFYLAPPCGHHRGGVLYWHSSVHSVIRRLSFCYINSLFMLCTCTIYFFTWSFRLWEFISITAAIPRLPRLLATCFRHVHNFQGKRLDCDRVWFN